MTDTSWIADATCASGQPAEIFFDGDVASTLLAKRVCALCPVQQECLDYAVDQGIEYGVWGGTSRIQRIALGMEIQHLPDEPLHGTHGAIKRHQQAGEPLCDACGVFSTEHSRAKWATPWAGVREVACVHGHLLDDENTYYYPNGRPECRTCRRDREARRMDTRIRRIS